ncbi:MULTISPECIES: hypothetical protein [Cupriavidus]
MMQRKRLLALLLAMVMSGAPLAWAKGSGFSAGSSSRSTIASPSPSRSAPPPSRPAPASPSGSSGSSREAPSPSAQSAGRTSGFGSGASTASKVGTAAAVTGLGGALYAAHANREAVETYHANANRATLGTDPASQSPTMADSQHSSAPSGATGRGTGGSTPAQVEGTGMPTPPSAPPAVLQVPQYSPAGSSQNGFWWYLLGRQSARHDTVVVQRPAGLAPSDAEHPLGVPQVAPPGRDTATEAPGFGRAVLTVLAWGLGAFAIVLAVYIGWQAWAVRKARFARRNHYTL